MDTAPARFNLARHCLAENARLRGGKTAMVIAGDHGAEERWTFAEVDQGVRAVAAGLRDLDLPPRARILIRMANGADYVLLFLGAIAAGHVALPASSQLTDEEAAFLIADSQASLAVMDRPFAGPADIPVLGPDGIAALKGSSPAADYADTGADDPAYMIYTSGTTRRPKGVLHAQRVVWGRRPMHAHWLGIGEHDVMLHAGAVNWTYTLGVGLLDPWAVGAGCVLYNGPRDPAVWLGLIERYRASIFAAVPSVYRQILKYSDPAAHDLSSLRHGLTAGEALPPALLAHWREAVGTPLYEALGMSEISTYISSGPTTRVKPGSPGRPQPGRRIAILPVDGGADPLPPGEVGLLAVHRSDPSLMLGYWNRPDEEQAVFRGEWFVGGDLAALDDDGYVWYHGRSDDIMNAMGYRVSPAEVENVLAALPAVAEVAVTELKVRADVSVIAAFVVPKPGARITAAEVLAEAERHLAAYKCPRQVVFTDHLPRTANGKVLRRRLPELAAGSSTAS